jgi:hypothetical protein
MAIHLGATTFQNYGNNWTEIRISPEIYTTIPLEGTHDPETDMIVRVNDQYHIYNGQGFKNISATAQQVTFAISVNSLPGKWFKIEMRKQGNITAFLKVQTDDGYVSQDEEEISRISNFGDSMLNIIMPAGSVLWTVRIKAVDIGIPELIYNANQSNDYFIIKSYLKTGKRDVRGGRGHYLIEISKRSDFRDSDIFSTSTLNDVGLFLEEKYNLDSNQVPTTAISGTNKLLTKNPAGSGDYSPNGANIGEAGWVSTIGLSRIGVLENFYFRFYIIDGNWE